MTRAAVGRSGSAAHAPESVRHFVVRGAFAITALVLQTLVPAILRFGALLNLPLLSVLYTTLGARTVVGPLLSGALIGWAHDGLTHGPLGVYGLVYTVLGYGSVVARQLVQPDRPAPLSAFVACAYLLHEILLFAIRRYLLDQQGGFEPVLWCGLTAVHVGLALAVFPALRRLGAKR